MNVSLVHHGPPVNHSERTAIEHIESRLKSEPGDDFWCLLTNILLSSNHHRQSDEIDIVAIGPPGVQIIEVKHWPFARIKKDPEGVGEEADRLMMKARRLAGFLRPKVKDIGYVYGAFLLTESASKTKGVDEAADIRGASFHSLKGWEKAIGFRGKPRLSPAEITKLADSLTKPGDRRSDGPPKRVGSYVHLKEVERPRQGDEDFCRIFQAVHSHRRSSAVVYLYDLTSPPDSGLDGDIRTKAERRWQALHRLQQYKWVPRIIDSFQDSSGHSGELCFFTIQDPAASNIRERMKDESWDIDARLEFCLNTVDAVRELHAVDVDMVHRNLNPSTILVGKDNSPILTGFNYARIPEQMTIASADIPKGLAEENRAPEVVEQGLIAAGPRTDVYSLCRSLAVLFSEDDPDPRAKGILEALSKGTQDNPEDRIELSALHESLKEYEKEKKSLVSSLPSPRYWTEDQIVPFPGRERHRECKIVSRLGRGGGGIAFRVEEVPEGEDREEDDGEILSFVGKVVLEREKSESSLRAYKLAESRLRHVFAAGETSLSKIIDTADEWHEKSFIALMSWVPGEHLENYSEEYLGMHVDEDKDESEHDLAMRWLRSICKALDSLHKNNLVHGDISPRNLIVSGDDLVVIDYDHVVTIGDTVEGFGTPDYSPYGPKGKKAEPANDFYSLAASFFKVLYNREPFRHGGDLAKDRGLYWEGLDRERYGVISDFMDKATHPDRSLRFTSAQQALAFLDGKFETQVAKRSTAAPKVAGEAAKKTIEVASSIASESERNDNEIDFLHSILQSYPGSKRGNHETRGLDTEFAEETYVQTKLFDVLLEDIKERRRSLIILCGNAGDGKTAILQRLAKQLGIEKDASSSQRILEGKLDKGLRVHINLDGSASWAGKSSDDLLDDSLQPFMQGKPSEKRVHLLAINDGRLLEWIERVEKKSDGQTPLTEELESCIQAVQDQQKIPEGSHIRFVSLNQRSLVGGYDKKNNSIDTTFLEGLLEQFYGGKKAPEIWAPCATCSAQDRCDILNATRLFAPDALNLPERPDKSRRERARRRFFTMLQAVHLRGEKHITMRELRASLAYILFGIHHCTDYHRQGIAKDEESVWWNRAFSPLSPARQGDVLSELVRFDPALESHPQIDRYLLSRPYIKDQDKALRYPGSAKKSLSSARRWAYFQWSEDEIEAIAGDKYALDLARGRYFRDFRDLEICGEKKRDELRDRLCRGISQIENLPPKALKRKGVPLRITPRTPTETAFWVEKERSDFTLRADTPPEQAGVDRFHHQATLVYRYQDGTKESLPMGADLFHLLLELGEGYQLGDISSDDVFAQLSIFVQRLVRENDRRLLAWNPMNEDEIYEIEAKEKGATGKQQIVIQSLGARE